MTPAETAVLKSLSCHLSGDPAPTPPLTLAQYTAVAIALRERGLISAQVETLHNDWTGTARTVVNAVWLTSEGRQVVREM